jgi:hypothetical protein
MYDREQGFLCGRSPRSLPAVEAGLRKLGADLLKRGTSVQVLLSDSSAGAALNAKLDAIDEPPGPVAFFFRTWFIC